MGPVPRTGNIDNTTDRLNQIVNSLFIELSVLP